MPGASLPDKILIRAFSGAASAALLLIPAGAAMAAPTVSPSTPSPAAGLQNRPARARDSFLYPPADSTAALVRAIEKDRALRLRYARHFHVSEDQFLNFVHRALITYRLRTGRTVTTYGVTRTGRIYPVRERLSKGTLVWATHSGVPILKWRCANPLTDRLPGFALPNGPRVSRAPSPAKIAPLPSPQLVATAPSNALPATPLGAPLLSAPPAFFAPLPLSGGGRTVVPVITPGPRGGSGWIFPIPILIGALIPHGGGGGPTLIPPPVIPPGGGTETPLPPLIPPPPGGGEVPPGGGGTPPPPGGETPPVIPEPEPIAVFSVALAFIGGLAVRQRLRRVKAAIWNVEAGS